MSTASTRIPTPKDWQEFERQIEVLARHYLDDPKAKGNGRLGQRQNGVDVYGQRKKRHWVGFQCKEHFEKEVTEQELRDEVAKAEKFEPTLSEFVLVTTAPRDAKIQKIARKLTDERSDFSVEVWGWEDVEKIVAQFPETQRAFDPDHSPRIEQEIRETHAEQMAKMEVILAEVRSRNASGVTSASNSPKPDIEENESTERHGQINLIQSMIDDGDILTAQSLLARFERTELSEASTSEHYRFCVAEANVAINQERFEQAGELLLKAASLHPEHKNAPSNRAIGFLLTGESQNAIAEAEKLLDADPENQKMAETLAQARWQLDWPEPLAGIPEALQNSAIMWGLRCTSARLSGDDDWRELAAQGHEAHPENKFLKRFAAEAKVDICTRTAPAFMAGERGASVNFDQIEEACAELVAQIEELRAIGGEVPPALAHNTALACRLVGKYEQAQAILRDAINDHPDELELVEQVAMHDVQFGDASHAIALLENVDRGIVSDLTLAAAKIRTGSLEEAKTLLDLHKPPLGVEPAAMQFYSVNFEWFYRQRLFDEGKSFFTDIAERIPTEVLPHLFLSKFERLTGFEKETASAVGAALELVSEETPFSVIKELAEEAFQVERFDVVVQLLKDRVANDHENDALTLCIAGAMNGDMHNTALGLLQRVPNSVSKERWYRRTWIALKSKIGDESTLSLLNEYLEDFPDDAEMRNARIGHWQTLGRIKDIRKDIKNTDFERLSGSPFSIMQFCRLATSYSDGSRSVPRAYELLLSNWDNVDCHAGYHGIFIANDKIAGIERAPDTVKTKSVFRVRTNGEDERWFRIEEQKPPVFGDQWLGPDDDLAKAFAGKSVGDRIEVDGAFGPISYEVLEIKSVFLDAFHRSINRFQERFPRSGVMLQLSVDTEADDPFADMKQMARRLAERDQELLSVYRDNPIPIVWLARLLGKDEIECSIGLPAQLGIPFRVCQGTHEERSLAFSVLKNNGGRGVIVDAVTAVMIRRLNIQEAVEAVCGPLKTTATTIERLTERYHEAQAMLGRSPGSFGYHEGQYFLTEVSEDDQRAALEVRKAEVEWARNNLEVVPSLPRTELDKDAKQMADMVGTRSIAPALAANGADLPLLADDFGIRLWSKAALEVEGLWLQPVLMAARDAGHISVVDYSEAIASIADAGFSYTSFDGPTLHHIIKKADYDVHTVSGPLKVLLGTPADLENNLPIAMSVIVALKKEGAPQTAIFRLASEIARAATYPRWEEAPQILHFIAQPFGQLMREHLSNWYWWNAMGSRS